jgi:hypothetical protein
MKKTINLMLLLISFVLTRYQLHAGAGHRDTITGLELRGRIVNVAENSEMDCKVELITSKGVVDSVFLKAGKRKFRFFLHKNEYYAVRISKKGFVTKLVSINTDVSEEFDDVFEFSFATKLVSERTSKRLNKDALDFPTSIIHFDPLSETFIHNKEYTDNIRREVYTPVTKGGNENDLVSCN